MDPRTLNRGYSAVATTDTTIAVIGAQAVMVWDEIRRLQGGTLAKVRAYVVPLSGVGWVDFTWSVAHGPPPPVSTPQQIKIAPEERRMLADWNGQDQSSVARQVIKVADEWFRHCTELAEREMALAALAAEERPAPRGPTGPTGAVGPTGRTGRTGPIVTGTGAYGVSATPAEQRKMYEELQRQMEEMRRQSRVARSAEELTIETTTGITGPPDVSLPPPSAGHETIEGVFVPLAGQTVVGASDGTSDGLSDPGDHVAEPHVGG